MEDQRPSLGDVRDKEDRSSKESSPGRFSQLLERLRYSPEEDDETEDDSPERAASNKPSKRWERFFGKLFRQTVRSPERVKWHKPALPEEVTPQSARTDLEAVPLVTAAETAVADLSTAESTPGQVPDASEQIVDEEAQQDTSRPSKEAVEVPVDDYIQEDLAGLDTEPLKPASLPNEALLYERNTASVSPPETAPPIMAEASSGRNERRRTALLTGLLGAEFWARRRADREIRRDINKLRKSAEPTITKARAAETRPATASELIPKLQPEIQLKSSEVRNKQQQPGKEQTPEQINSIHTAERLKPMTTQLKEVQYKQPDFEQSPEPKLELPVMDLPKPEKAVFAEALKPKPETAPEHVLKVVAEAAERDIPIEKDYERRHEVKDASTKVATGVASVGAILTGMGIDSSGSPVHAQATPQIVQQNSPLQQDKPVISKSSDMYQQAVKAGFWSAMVIIVSIIVIGLTGN